MDERTLARFWSKVDRSGLLVVPALGPCWVWTGCRLRDGYGRFRCDGKIHLAHRVAWRIEHGQWPNPCALHTCDGGPLGCVRPAHLFEGTRADNNHDRDAKGRASPPSIRCVAIRGERHHNSRLTTEQVLAIRAALADGASPRFLAERYDVNRRTISDIGTRRWWRHV